jgi:hypothetical protein
LSYPFLMAVIRDDHADWWKYFAIEILDFQLSSEG